MHLFLFCVIDTCFHDNNMLVSIVLGLNFMITCYKIALFFFFELQSWQVVKKKKISLSFANILSFFNFFICFIQTLLSSCMGILSFALFACIIYLFCLQLIVNTSLLCLLNLLLSILCHAFICQCLQWSLSPHIQHIT